MKMKYSFCKPCNRIVKKYLSAILFLFCSEKLWTPIFFVSHCIKLFSIYKEGYRVVAFKDFSNILKKMSSIQNIENNILKAKIYDFFLIIKNSLLKLKSYVKL